MNAAAAMSPGVGPFLRGQRTRLGQALFGARRPSSAQQTAFEGAMAGTPASAAAGEPALRMAVLSGRHAGAVESFLVGKVSIGSGAQCDVILSDAGVQPVHLQLVRDRGRWRLKDLSTGRELMLGDGRGGSERFQVACGPARLRFQVRRDKRVPPRSDPSAKRALALSALTGVALTAVIVTAVYWEQVWRSPSSQELSVAGARELVQAGFREVTLEPEPGGGLALSGFVSDEAQAARLYAWQRDHELYRNAAFKVLVASRLTDRLNQDLAAKGVNVAYRGRGRFSVEGTTRDMQMKERLTEFTRVLRGRVSILDNVLYIDEVAKSPGKPRPLPFRIVNVMLGERSYFQTDSGSRYFVGSRLPDGTSVVSIDARRVTFMQGNTEVVYPLG